MYTLFFAGNTCAPGLRIDGEPAQDWLQERYLACMRHCFRRLKNCKAIVGWGIRPLLGAPGDLTALEKAEQGPIPGVSPVEKAKFADEFFNPFMARFTERMREVNPAVFIGEIPTRSA
jgi:hypothetical protein